MSVWCQGSSCPGLITQSLKPLRSVNSSPVVENRSVAETHTTIADEANNPNVGAGKFGARVFNRYPYPIQRLVASLTQSHSRSLFEDVVVFLRCIHGFKRAQKGHRHYSTCSRLDVKAASFRFEIYCPQYLVR